jgi:hypothetical protein
MAAGARYLKRALGGMLPAHIFEIYDEMLRRA